MRAISPARVFQMSNWMLLLLAAMMNIGTVYFAKASEFTL